MTDSSHIIDQYLAERPLMDFSVYTNIQIEILDKMETTIVDMFNNRKDAYVIMDIYGSFWLWTLGAYEIVRTMAQAKSCFSIKVNKRVLHYKRKIAKIRVPFAKQEYQGKNRPIFNEASISGMDIKKGDMFFTVEGVEYSIRTLMKEFRDLMASIKGSDIIQRHEDSYKRTKS